MEQWELVAREAIRDLVARYNANGDSGRIDAVVALFAPDAVLDVMGKPHTGHDEIRRMFDQAIRDMAPKAETPAPAAVQHHTSTVQIDVVDEQHARARSYFQVLMNGGIDHWGRYVDEFGVVDGRWLFTQRKVTVSGAAAGGWAANR
ncbi:MAG: nuclear transport factor 2 family protein [Actinomycetes bacterium]